MATGIATRVRRLEDTGGGGGECSRCSGVVEVFVCGKLSSASKHGEEMTEGEYRQFVDEEDEEGRCPVCGGKSVEITVGWPENLPATS